MIRSFIESLFVHSILLALLFVGAAVAGSGKIEKPTLISMSTSIIDTPPPGPVEEPPGIPEPTPPEPKPEPPKPKPKPKPKEVKKPEPKPEPEEVAPVPVEKTVEEVAEADESDNSTEVAPEPIIAAVPMPINPEGRGGGKGGAHDSASAGGPSDGVYSLRDLDHRPRALSNSKPNYPRYASENRIEGTVTVSFILDKKGNVQNPEIVKSTPSNVFESSALTAVKKWKFTPAKKNGELVNVRMVVAVNFTLEN